MRSEKEMFQLITSVAESDANISAVILNGSRANPNAIKDKFQDYDIVYFLNNFSLYTNNLKWIEQFGELMILQTPDLMGDAPPVSHKFTYLMQFVDGNRIDLTVFDCQLMDLYEKDSQTIVLLDKDGLFSNTEPASDNDYLPKPPSSKAYYDCCNEFWWVSTYVAKGLCRNEITYAKNMFESVIRVELMKMLTWAFAIQTNYKITAGKSGKNIKNHIASNIWERYLKTYSDSSIANNWAALFVATELFRELATDVARCYYFQYTQAEDDRVGKYLSRLSGSLTN